jgi:hypothetical protein
MIPDLSLRLANQEWLPQSTTTSWHRIAATIERRYVESRNLPPWVRLDRKLVPAPVQYAQISSTTPATIAAMPMPSRADTG